MPTKLSLPTIPYSLIDAVNRAALATGSIRAAAAGHQADYNGHRVAVYFNDFRRYWVADYTWAGRVVLARGSFANCLAAALREYARGALGSSVHVSLRDEDLDEAQLAVLHGFLPTAEAEAKDASWRDARYAETHHALSMERQLGIPAVDLLIRSTSVEDFHAKFQEYCQERARLRKLG
jgi:hypothetical protein